MAETVLRQPQPALPPSPTPAPPARPAYRVVVADGAAAAARRADWQGLADDALEPNAFLEPWFLLPALRHLPGGADVRFALVYAGDALAGLVPLCFGRLGRLAPVRVAAVWRHHYGFLSTPLLRRGHADAAMLALLGWLARDRRGAALLRLDLVHADGPFARLLGRLMYEHHRPAFQVEEYSRALIEVGACADEYLARAMAKKRLREVRRKFRVFETRGHFERRVLRPGDDLTPWVEDFLALEASGWKGQGGTAFRCQAADAAFLREMAAEAHAAGRLQGLGLYLDGKPVALKLNLLSPPGAFSFKIAFDESFYSQSPGVLLEVAHIEHLHAARPVRWMDSCAVAHHPMIDKLWTERRAVQTLYLATGRAPGDLLVSLMPLGRWLKRLVRRRAAPPVVAEEGHPE